MRNVLKCAAIATAIAPAVASAQTVEFVVVEKGVFHRQTDAATVSQFAPGDLPFLFAVNVEGVDVDLLAPPSVTGPMTLGEPGLNGGVLGYDPDDGSWRFGAPGFIDWGTETKDELDTLFPNGTYTVTVDGASVAISLVPGSYSNAPTLTLTGGYWAGGVYNLEPDQELTITSSAHSNYGSATGAA